MLLINHLSCYLQSNYMCSNDIILLQHKSVYIIKLFELMCLDGR